jgi:serine protease AprX
VNLAGSIIIPGPNPNGGFGDGGPLKQGQNGTVTINIPQKRGAKGRDANTTGTGYTLKVTLVWTDPPGAKLQNDLDLIVKTSNGQVRHGNMGTSKNFDRVNNVEQVVWANIPPRGGDDHRQRLPHHPVPATLGPRLADQLTSLSEG